MPLFMPGNYIIYLDTDYTRNATRNKCVRLNLRRQCVSRCMPASIYFYLRSPNAQYFQEVLKRIQRLSLLPLFMQLAEKEQRKAPSSPLKSRSLATATRDTDLYSNKCEF